MLRTATMSAAALLGLTLLAPTGASAAGETCQARPATIVGAQDQTVDGTEGADVIVSNGATRVVALGGDDLICVTGISNPGIYAGEGDDVVVSTLDPESLSTFVLGPGSDRFTGSSASDVVYAGGKKRLDPPDTDRDVIDTGPSNGEYGDYVVSGHPGIANSDDVRVSGGTSGRGGSASTVELHGHPTPQSVLDGGGGSELTLDTSHARSVTIDTVAGTYARDDDRAAISGFDDFLLTDDGGPRYLTFRGSERDEGLTMTFTDNPAYDVELGAGDDEVVVETDRIHRRITRFDGGDGHDQVGLVMPTKEIRLDLRRGRLLAGKPARAVPAAALDFEDAEVVADRIEIVGTRDDNELRAWGCHATVRALKGDDKVSPLTLLYDAMMRCPKETTRFEGGPGADVLAGDSADDVLIGGPGRDVANGRTGRDTCQAEKQRGCEVSLRPRTGGHHE